MIWKIEKKPENGIMFCGEGYAVVVNRRGERGVAEVQYYPYCGVVGPVLEDVEDREPQVLDRRPTFRY